MSLIFWALRKLGAQFFLLAHLHRLQEYCNAMWVGFQGSMLSCLKLSGSLCHLLL
jgi:hypothetical protein